LYLPVLQNERSSQTKRQSLDVIVLDGHNLHPPASVSCCLHLDSQYTICDPYISNKHLRIYTILYDGDGPSDVAPLVYAEDLSRNGTYWNGSLIGKGNGGFLLSEGDTLRLSSLTLLRFESVATADKECFDLTQENEMEVCIVLSPPSTHPLTQHAGFQKGVRAHRPTARWWCLRKSIHGYQQLSASPTCLQGCRSSPSKSPRKAQDESERTTCTGRRRGLSSAAAEIDGSSG
jgi:hypothetical protein